MGRIYMLWEKDGLSGVLTDFIVPRICEHHFSSIDTKTEAIDIRKRAHECVFIYYSMPITFFDEESFKFYDQPR